MNEKNRKKKQAQELASNRILVMFVLVVLLLWIMSYVYRMMTIGSTFLMGKMVNRVLMIVSAAAAAVFGGIFLNARKKGTFRRNKVFNSAFFAIASLMLAACCLILTVDFYHGLHVIYVFLPAIAVLYLIYYFFERRFFTFCLVEAIAICAAYCCFRGAWEWKIILAVAAACCLLMIVLALLGGESAKKLKKALLGKQYQKRNTVLVYAVTLLLLAVIFLLKGKAALAIGILLGVVLLGMAVYHTVRSM